MNYENCPRPGWLNYPASFSAPAAWYHQQSRKSKPVKYAASGHWDPIQVISQASFWKEIAFLTHNKWEWRTRNIQKGPCEVFWNFQAPEERVCTILNIGCFHRESPQSSYRTVQTMHRRGELSLFGPAANVCPAACGREVFHNRGILQFVLETCDHRTTGEDRTVRAKGDWRTFNLPQAPGPCVLWHETLQEECDIKGNKGICDQIILVWRILIGLSTQRSSNTSK